MIRKDSERWKLLLENLNYSKTKSNRDVLCVKCWKILKYEENIKHKTTNPDHMRCIFTSKDFASESKFINVA